MRQYTAGPNDDGVRLSRFVLRVTRGLPQSLLYKSFRSRRIKVNGRRAAPDTRLTAGDIIELYLNDEFFPESPTATALPSSAALPSFEILWQDASMAVLYKPPGVLCHSDATGDATLLDAFTVHLVATGEYTPGSENAFAPALANRLDRGTEGLVLAAKTYPALRDLNGIIRESLLQKTYLAITVGTPPQGTFQAYLQRDKAAHTTSVSQQPAPGAKPIATGIRVLQTKNGIALCEIALHTGRTHQIRAHLAHLGAPILGDARYGNTTINRSLHVSTQALCAFQLHFADTLSPDNTLAYLAGRTFTTTHSETQKLWDSL